MTLDNPQLQTQIEIGRWALGMAGPDTKNTDTPYPIWGFGPPSPEPDTQKLDALLASLNGSAERFQTLWFSFLGLTLYLAIAALATTHRDLLLREPQVLPLVNIKVQLLPFYIIAPLLYLVFDFYVLLMLLLLARTSAEFEDELRNTLKDNAAQERYRARIQNAFILQLLVGMKDERVGLNSLLLRAIAFLTLILFPILTLILMQMMFLPYHSLPMTWWHRAVIVADTGMMLFLWYRLAYLNEASRPPLLFHDRSRPLITFALAGSLVVFAFWLSFWEGHWVGEPGIGRRDFTSTADGVVFGLFPDRLKLANETIVGKENLEKTKEEMASRGGDSVPMIGFVPTIDFDYRDLQAADLSGTDLRRVSLSGAAMRGADLRFARLDRARLQSAQLQGADLSYARLYGADLSGAQLQGVNLPGAQLQGATIGGAQLQGANLEAANLQGAMMGGAQLQGANLERAYLQGATLASAQLQGADLSDALLQGSTLASAQLQGAKLGGADMADSELDETFLFRADVGDAKLARASIGPVRADKFKRSSPDAILPLTAADVETWMTAATRFAPERARSAIAERFGRLKASFQIGDQERARGVTWSGMSEASLTLDPNSADHRRRLATGLGKLACNADGAPYVAEWLVFLRFPSLSDQLGDVLSRMKAGRDKPETCPGVAGFTEEDWRRLDAIKPD